MLSVGVLGDTNCGKSTLLNALLGSRLLPSRRTSCTSVLTHCLLDGGSRATTCGAEAGSPVLLHEGGEVVGASAVRSKIEELNERIRSDGDTRVFDLLLHTGARSELGDIADGMMKLIDVPGHNESDNPVVRECKDVVTSLCHGLMILVKYDNITSDTTADLIQGVAEDAPHLFDACEPGLGLAPVVFVITQVDQVRDGAGLDGDDSSSEETTEAELKKAFRAFLRRRPGLSQFAGFADRVPILASGIDREVLAGRRLAYDLEELLRWLNVLHGGREALIEARKVRYATRIALPLRGALTRCLASGSHPVIATDVIERHCEQRRKLIMAAVSVSTIAVGGWMACAAWAARGIALSQATAASAVAATAAAKAVSASTAAAAAGTAAAAAATSAEAAAAGAAAITSTSASVGTAAAGLSTTAALAADGGLMGSPLLGAAVGYAAKWVSWAALGGRSASQAVAATAAAAATAQAAAAAATANQAAASVAAATASSIASSAAASVSSATATVAAYTSLALAGGVAAMRVALVGNQVIVTAPGLGCLGARRAVEEIATPTLEAIEESEAADGKPYQDFLMWPGSEERVLYAGGFRGKLPHGAGRLFWHSTQVEAFIGEFRHGRIHEGVFVSDRQVAIGRLRREGGPDGEARFVVAGFQPESMYDPTEPCAICLEHPTILTEGRVMAPCHHGCVCSPCLATLRECPICRSQVTSTLRVC